MNLYVYFSVSSDGYFHFPRNKSIIPFDSRGLISFMSRDQKIASTLVMTDDVLQEQVRNRYSS